MINEHIYFQRKVFRSLRAALLRQCFGSGLERIQWTRIRNTVFRWLIIFCF